jgi:hypothetical protein
VAVAGLLYLGAGVALGSRQGRGLGLRAHHHYGLWMGVRALVLDGVARAGLAQKPRVVLGSGARHKGAAKKSSQSTCNSSGSGAGGGGGGGSSSSRSHSKKSSSRKGKSKEQQLLGGANASSPSAAAAEGGGSGVAVAKEWRPTQTGFLSVGGRETGVKTQTRLNAT